MKKIIALVGALMLILGVTVLFSTPASATGGDDHKRWVCKYVGTPNVDERLKDGKNPISVDSAATVGTYFNDAQGRSYVLAVQTEANTGPGNTYKGDLTCPPADEPPTPVLFSFSDPTPPTCETAGAFLQQAFEGVSFDIEPEYDGPGTYTVTATLDDPENTTFPDGTTAPKTREVTVQGAIGFQSEDSEAPCFQTPTPTPTETTPTPTPTETSGTPTPTPTESTPTSTPTKTTPPDGPDELPKTGAPTPLIAGLGALLAALGSGFMFLTRKPGLHE